MPRQIKNYSGFIVLFIIFMIVFLFLFPEMQRRPVHFLTRPLVFVLSEIQGSLTGIGRGLGNIWFGYINLASVRSENERLRLDLARLRNENIRLQEVALTHERLGQILEFKKEGGPQFLLASVIGRDPSNWYRTVMIDKGEKDGVEVEMGAVSPHGVVGRVIKTNRSVSQVLLLTDRNSAVAGRVQRTRDEGLIEGTERGLARMRYLSLLAEARAGDLVLTSGLAGIFPKGLLIGTLGPVMKEEPDLFQQAEIIPSMDFSKLEEVMIITSLDPDESGQ